MYVYLSLIFFMCVFLKFEALCESHQPLIVTSLLRQGKYKEAERLARVHYEKFNSNLAYSGYFEVDSTTNSHLFFWFFPSESNNTDPVILCLQGGPGISSLFWLFLENGPYYLDLNGNLGRRNHSWTKTNSVLYIDIPAEVGFSVTEREDGYSLAEVTDDLMEAIKQFFNMFPDLQANPFFIVGESYGGKYVSSLANSILDYNQNVTTKINLTGVAIGNGLINPKHQIGYGTFLYQTGLINEETKKKFEQLEQQQNEYIDKKQWDQALQVLNEIYTMFVLKTGLEHMFNILESTETNLLYEKQMEILLNLKEVQEALHVDSKNFSTYLPMSLIDDFTSVSHMVERLLNESCPVLFYNGQLDARVPYVSVVNCIKGLKFPESHRYVNARNKLWTVNGEVAGYVKQVGSLTEVIVRNAGHMAAMDKSEWIYNLIEKFAHRKVIWG